MEIHGKAVTFGNDVNTDVIIPSRYLTDIDPKELAKHAMEGIAPDFTEKNQGEIILVAGTNFGCGSSREQAPIALKYAGVNAILAESFARIFYRNAINIGLPVLQRPQILDKVEEGDELSINLTNGEVKNLSKNESFQTGQLPLFILQIIQDGGLIRNIKKRLSNERL
ncbi:MAG: 3-isopropylmalate dehydratase small subunit [Thermoproteota archaeon]